MRIVGCFLVPVLAALSIAGHAQTSSSRHHDVIPSPKPVSKAAAENSNSDSTLAAWHFQVAQRLEEVGEFDDALDFYKVALESADPNLQAKVVKALTELLKKRRLGKKVNDSKNGYLELGRSWRNHGKPDEAIAAYEKALDAESPEIRTNAADELAALVKMKTTWWREYVTNPTFAFITSKPVVFMALVGLVALVVRAFLRRTDLLLIPNPSVPDTQWLQILIHDYRRQMTQSHSFASPGSSVPLVLFGHAAELLADLLSRVTKVDSSSWRQWFVKFFEKPRYELYLSLPPSNQGGIVTAALSKTGGVTDCFVKEFSSDELSTVQKDLAFWVAYHIGRRENE